MVFQSMQSNLNNKKQFLQHFKLVHYKKTKKNTHQNLRDKYRKMSYRFCNAFCLQHHNFFLPYLVKPTHNQCCTPPKQNKGQFCTCSMILYSKFIPPLILLTRAQIPPPKKKQCNFELNNQGTNHCI